MLVDQSKPPWRIWPIFRPTRIAKIMVHVRTGGVRDYLLCGIVSLVYRTKADTNISGWRRLGRELWDLIHQLSGAEMATTDTMIA